MRDRGLEFGFRTELARQPLVAVAGDREAELGPGMSRADELASYDTLLLLLLLVAVV